MISFEEKANVPQHFKNNLSLQMMPQKLNMQKYIHKAFFIAASG